METAVRLIVLASTVRPSTLSLYTFLCVYIYIYIYIKLLCVYIYITLSSTFNVRVIGKGVGRAAAV